MKLQNRKTGEIVELLAKPSFVKRDKENYLASEVICFDSLAELNEEWEDYEEPKEYWFIDEFGMIQQETDYYYDENKSAVHDKRLEVGNYFETKEEAEKAVEKLKAWKRLKDNGFKFEGIEKRGHHINFYQGRSYETDKQCQQAMKDLDLLFGGEG